MTDSPPGPGRPTALCYACRQPIDAVAEICPKCGVRQRAAPVAAPAGAGSDTKLAAGLCGIFCGAFGVHKFIIGATSAGVIMLLVSVLTCGIGGLIMGPIGLVEGIIYLSKSNEEFERLYVVGKKPWF
jgi:TM2 domain-containing membrane protein YozV